MRPLSLNRDIDRLRRGASPGRLDRATPATPTAAMLPVPGSPCGSPRCGSPRIMPPVSPTGAPLAVRALSPRGSLGVATAPVIANVSSPRSSPRGRTDFREPVGVAAGHSWKFVGGVATDGSVVTDPSSSSTFPHNSAAMPTWVLPRWMAVSQTAADAAAADAAAAAAAAAASSTNALAANAGLFLPSQSAPMLAPPGVLAPSRSLSPGRFSEVGSFRVRSSSPAASPPGSVVLAPPSDSGSSYVPAPGSHVPTTPPGAGGGGGLAEATSVAPDMGAVTTAPTKICPPAASPPVPGIPSTNPTPSGASRPGIAATDAMGNGGINSPAGFCTGMGKAFSLTLAGLSGPFDTAPAQETGLLMSGPQLRAGRRSSPPGSVVVPPTSLHTSSPLPAFQPGLARGLSPDRGGTCSDRSAIRSWRSVGAATPTIVENGTGTSSASRWRPPAPAPEDAGLRPPVVSFSWSAAHPSDAGSCSFPLRHSASPMPLKVAAGLAEHRPNSPAQAAWCPRESSPLPSPVPAGMDRCGSTPAPFRPAPVMDTTPGVGKADRRVGSPSPPTYRESRASSPPPMCAARVIESAATSMVPPASVADSRVCSKPFRAAGLESAPASFVPFVGMAEARAVSPSPFRASAVTVAESCSLARAATPAAALPDRGAGSPPVFRPPPVEASPFRAPRPSLVVGARVASRSAASPARNANVHVFPVNGSGSPRHPSRGAKDFAARPIVGWQSVAARLT